MKKIIIFVYVMIICTVFVAAFDSNVGFVINSLAGLTEIDNSEGTSVSISLEDNNGPVTGSPKYAAAGIYNEGMTITPIAPFTLKYGTTYTYTILYDGNAFSYEFTTPFAGGLPETGQTNCWDENGVIVLCADTGQDGEYTSGIPRMWRYSDDGTIDTQEENIVTDLVTGLTWLRDHTLLDSSGGVGGNVDLTITYDPQNIFTVCRGLNYAGYTDWRLPNVFEFYTILNFADPMSQQHPSPPPHDTMIFMYSNIFSNIKNYYALNTINFNNRFPTIPLTFSIITDEARVGNLGNSRNILCVRG